MPKWKFGYTFVVSLIATIAFLFLSIWGMYGYCGRFFLSFIASLIITVLLYFIVDNMDGCDFYDKIKFEFREGDDA